MEKVVAALWQVDSARLLAELPGALATAGAISLRLNLRDAAVEPAASLIQRWQEPQQDAVAQFWLPSANARFRAGVDAALASQCRHFAMWLVAESVVIANQRHPPQPGQRTWGWSQASFISFRADIEREAALRHWHGHHTRVAIETQSNFEYVQNAIVCPLTEDAPAYGAFVEECFPPEAMTEPAAFYDAAGGAASDRAKFDANLAAMMESCAAFIDFARIDILPTSQYDFARRVL